MATPKLAPKGPRVHDVGIVYGLICAEAPDAVRYVGFTTVPLSKRIKAHRSDARKGFKKSVSVWLADLLARGIEFRAVVLKTQATYADEIEFIRRHREAGAALLNETDGGPGLRGMTPTAAMRAARRLPASPNQRAWVNAFNAGRDYTVVSEKQKLRYLDPEERARTARAVKAAKALRTPEQKAASLAKLRATLAERAAARFQGTLECLSPPSVPAAPTRRRR